MDEEPKPRATFKGWQPVQLAALSVVFLAVGFLAGYWLRGSAPPTAGAASNQASSNQASSNQASSNQASSNQVQTTAPSPSSMSEAAADLSKIQTMPHKGPTLDDLKHSADLKAAPLLEKLQSDPKNPKLQNQIGLIYESAHRFKEAATYFEESLQYDPKNIGVRADYASCLYYTGDVDGALAQLNQSLAYDARHAGTLINIGIIKWRGKNDVDGAVAAWEKLLRYHPDFPQKELVQHMITQAKQTKFAETVKDGPKG